ncbi:hypothetical protein FRC06_004297, partial [Ceratobasidium sp. 370]
LPVGHTLESCTQEVTTTGIPIINVSGIEVQLIDTPGFDDSRGSDIEVLKAISKFLVDSFHQGQLVTGIIYMHRITDTRLSGSGRRSLRTFRQLCGESSLQNVLLLTSMWSSPPTTRELSNERELQIHPLVSDFGCAPARLADRSKPEGRRIIGQCIWGSPQVLAIQKEMAQAGLSLEYTQAYQAFDEVLAEQRRQYEWQVEELRQSRAAEEEERQQAIAEERRQSKLWADRLAAFEAERTRLAEEQWALEAEQRAAREQEIAIAHRRQEVEKAMRKKKRAAGVKGVLAGVGFGVAIGLMI